DAGIKSAIQGSNVPNPDEAVPSFVSGAMAKAGKGLLEGTLQAGTSAVSDKLLDLVGLGGKSLMISYLLVVEQHRTQIVIHALLKCQQENLYHEQNVTHISTMPCRTCQAY